LPITRAGRCAFYEIILTQRRLSFQTTDHGPIANSPAACGLHVHSLTLLAHCIPGHRLLSPQVVMTVCRVGVAHAGGREKCVSCTSDEPGSRKTQIDSKNFCNILRRSVSLRNVLENSCHGLCAFSFFFRILYPVYRIVSFPVLDVIVQLSYPIELRYGSCLSVCLSVPYGQLILYIHSFRGYS